jgi:hypothetical protein
MTDGILERLALFQRVYEPCACGGWDERFEGRTIHRTLFGDPIAEPTGEVLAGRRNHKHECPEGSN